MAIIAKTIYHKLREPLAINDYSKTSLPFLEIKEDQYKARFTSFSEITFESLVHFSDVNLSIGLMFNSCRFNGPVLFKNISANEYDDILNPDSQSIVFKNCIFTDTIKFSGMNSVIERSLAFENCIFEKNFEIDYLRIELEGLFITNCTFNQQLILSSIFARQDIRLHECVIKLNVRIGDINCEQLAFTGESIFSDDLFIKGSIANQGIIFNQGLFKKDVLINQCITKEQGLIIIGSEFEKSVFVSDYQKENGVNLFYFSDSQFINGIYINGTENIFSKFPSIKKIEISISPELKGNIVFKNFEVEVLILSGYNSNTNILFDHLHINQIKIIGLINNAGLVFSRIRCSYENHLNNEIYINDSNLGKAQFYHTDFNSFSKISFRNNIISDISTSLITWFNPEKLNADEESISWKLYEDAKKSKKTKRINYEITSLISMFRSKQEIFRQLKFAAQKQGDIPTSLEFQQHEMNYYRKIIHFRKPRKWSEFLILWSNQSNDFGQNWIKAFWLLILFSFLSYLPIGFLNSDKLDYSSFANSYEDISLNLKVLFYDNIKNWIVVLNPLHRISDINENIDIYSNWIYLWDLISRTIVSYFIFQMISAFRKFNK